MEEFPPLNGRFSPVAWKNFPSYRGRIYSRIVEGIQESWKDFPVQCGRISPRLWKLFPSGDALEHDYSVSVRKIGDTLYPIVNVFVDGHACLHAGRTIVEGFTPLDPVAQQYSWWKKLPPAPAFDTADAAPLGYSLFNCAFA